MAGSGNEGTRVTKLPKSEQDPLKEPHQTPPEPRERTFQDPSPVKAARASLIRVMKSCSRWRVSSVVSTSPTHKSPSQPHIQHGGTRRRGLPTTERDGDGDGGAGAGGGGADGADVPWSFSASLSALTSFSSKSANFSPSCAGRARDHA